MADLLLTLVASDFTSSSPERYILSVWPSFPDVCDMFASFLQIIEFVFGYENRYTIIILADDTYIHSREFKQQQNFLPTPV